MRRLRLTSVIIRRSDTYSARSDTYSPRSDLLPPIRRLLHVSRSQAGAEPCMVIGLDWGLMTRKFPSSVGGMALTTAHWRRSQGVRACWPAD